MQIHLSPLEHQQRAISAVTHVFDGVEIKHDGAMEANPTFDPADPVIKRNISELQSGMIEDIEAIPSPWRTRVDDGVLGIDVKMETGTGKTLVYVQLMHELNRLYAFNKFLLLVPSTAVKEGTRSFINSNYADQYFNDAYGGRIKLKLEVLDPQKRRKGRKIFPSAIANFASASRLIRGRVSSLLMNEGMLLSNATMATTYDQTVLGNSSVPYDALSETRPIVIIDEPHRFRRENKAYRTMLEQISPQAIIRFGATFPKLEKEKRTDYNNLVFNLGAVEAFNEQLVKGVAIQYPHDVDEDTTRLRLTSMSVRRPKHAAFKNVDTNKTLSLDIGDSLAQADGDFSGITVEAIGKTENPQIKSGVTLSNGQIITKGDTIAARVYSDTYQGVMMQRALDNHFEAEWENYRRSTKVKTLTLFFIDSVSSYRGDENDGHLRIRFEELLAARIKAEIAKRRKDVSPQARDYVAYLEASLADIKATNGGYFSADNSTSDEAVQAEVDQILRDKQKLLAFTNSDGTLNTMRFIFSKWTLREGWDNPNVFQIVKLRSSGSEISKLQEVGRGLRLPVDEKGTRLASEQFYLTYLIDYTEREFADSLVTEVNSDTLPSFGSVKELLPKVAHSRDIDPDDLFYELWRVHKFIDRDYNIIPGKESELYEAYPEFNDGKVRPDKIITDTSKARVGIRSHRYAELKDLWEKVNAKYYLQLDRLTEPEIDQCIDDIFGNDIFRSQTGRITQETIETGDDGKLETRLETKASYDATEPIAYGQWLRLAYEQTYLPVRNIHAGLIRANKNTTLRDDFFNKRTLGEFVAQFSEWMRHEFVNRFSYARVESDPGATALTSADGKPLKNIVQGNIGIHRDTRSDAPAKFLYDTFVFDSPKEQETIRDSSLDEVVVYGKIPRRSIRVPLYFGGTTSPDFMYVLKREDGDLSLNFIVETKDIDKYSDMRESEQLRMEAAKKFFKSMSEENIKVQFAPQLKRDDIVSMLKRITSETL